MKYAQIIETQVVNVIVWDGETDLSLEGELIPTENVGVGWSYSDSTFSPPPAEPEPE